jgi:hypothetical protein
VAQKRRRKKRSWRRTLLLFILTPVAVWFLAFVVWFYWDDIASLFTRDKEIPTGRPKAGRKAEPPSQKRSGEKILDEDRKKLEEIIKRKSN